MCSNVQKMCRLYIKPCRLSILLHKHLLRIQILRITIIIRGKIKIFAYCVEANTPYLLLKPARNWNYSRPLFIYRTRCRTRFVGYGKIFALHRMGIIRRLFRSWYNLQFICIRVHNGGRLKNCYLPGDIAIVESTDSGMEV